ncbi:hypothetical protein [Endozoicomonas sp. 8E]|uniref:hypothetical protein n=1 Tax=Endozoicomonas sp. 8E TaxID=3035692 RepID=UPI002938EEA4|nr:hypothetical protein [Endozoicomonas sp. 8E]WOG26963.1 hypothetical protein P6910_20795 [Endozoicomonas sp. 8E]
MWSILPFCKPEGKDRNIKLSLLGALLSLLVMLPVACHTEPLTSRLILEFEQNEGFPNRSFSIKRDLHTLRGNPSDIAHAIAHTIGYARSDSSPDEKRYRTGGYRVKTTITEPVSWQWLYATRLLVAYELILTTKEAPLCATSYSRLPIEAVFAVVWLLTNYWNLNSLLFNPIEQQVASMLTQGNQPFVSITTMFGSGGTQQIQPSESSGQQVPEATTHPTDLLTGRPYSGSGSGDGNKDPQQHSHTLGLNCFFYPCNGVCQFRTSSDSSEPAEWPLNFEESLTGQTRAIPKQSSCPHLANGYCFSCLDHFDFLNPANAEISPSEIVDDPSDIPTQCPYGLSSTTNDFAVINGPLNLKNLREKIGISIKLTRTDRAQAPVAPENAIFGTAHCQQTLSDDQRSILKEQICNETVVGKDGRQRPCGSVCKHARSLACHKSKYHTGQKTCKVTIVGEGGRRRTCGRVFEHAQALFDHRANDHSKQQNCDVIVVGKDGQQRPCGATCKNAKTLWYHKSKSHSGQQVCDLMVIGEDGQLQPCKKVFSSERSLTNHKSAYHTRQKVCLETVIGKDGQPGPCGIVCKNSQAFSDHKRLAHTGQKTCNAIVIGKDGQPGPCGKVYKNAKALTSHKSHTHSGQKTCGVIVVGEDNRQRPCGKVLKNSEALSNHKRKDHAGQQICDLMMIGKDGQQRPCGIICKNAKILSEHRSRHRKRKPVDADQN